MGLHQNVAVVIVALMALGTIQPPEVDAQLCFYYVSSIRSRSVAVRSYYYYYRYYYYSCGWWGWRRCSRSYRVYVYYYYYYTAYNVYYIQKHYCCWGYYGQNCDPYCPNWCGRCSSCISPYYCSCQSGWTGSSCCSDFNECLYANGGCEQNCHNTVGSYYCSCNSGYYKSGSHCYDVNECNSNNGGCSHNCHNTNGGYYCSCPTGYYLSGKTCYDTNECNSNNGGCEQNCINQQGTYHCTCDEGYDLADDKHDCDDHNECTNGEANCNHHCVNTPGGYYCYCNTGYELDIDDETCIDTNECLSNNGGCEQDCTNTIGSYKCSCGDGYTLNAGDQHSCDDIDECSPELNQCDHFCENTIGSYVCDCKVGYALHDDDHSCHDINECNTDNGGCDHTCVNEVGTYHCECNVGFLLDEDNHGCSDHDECATNVHDCDTLAPATCHNSHGSYYCTCPIGFRLNADGRTCDDIDECEEKSSGCTQICNNIYGSYFCTCHDGFSLDSNQHSCSDIDECAVNAQLCQDNCHNLIGSYYCSCNTGYTLSSDDHTCVGIPCDPQLEAPENGGMECTGDQITGESCTFSCRYGFELMGSTTRTCQTNSLWTGLTTFCQHLYCPKLKDPKNGYIATAGCTSYFESTCEVKCVDGYYIDGPSPHMEKCSVNENNELFWYPKYTCEYIPPCQSQPCLHGGVCNEVTMSSYYCDCGDSLYTGLNCEIGFISIGQLPVINVGDTITVPIAGTPDSSVTVSVSVSSSDVSISQSSFTFDSSNPSSSFDLSVSTPGVYSISYELSGDDADNYDTPATSILIVVDPDVQHVKNDYFLKNDNPVGILSEGCCSPGTQYQCPGGVVNTVSFSSNCAWDNLGTTEYSTPGVVFAKGAGINIPISLTGAHMTLSEDSYGGFMLPDLSEECRVCDNLDPATCNYYDFTPNDYIDLLRTRALETTFLKEIDGMLPDWITLMVTELDLTGQVAFGVDDFTSYLTTGENIYEVPGCESLDLEPDSLFAVLSQDKNITVEVDGVSMKYAPSENDEPICFAVNLCKGSDSPVHITVPSVALDFITSYDAIQAYINNGWAITFKEFLLSDDVITFDNDGHTTLAPSYWVGEDQLVNSADVVPNFEFRANVDMKRLFWEDGDNLCLDMSFSGDIYHQSSLSGSDVEGVLSGDLTVSFNMTIDGKSGYMTFITTSTAALFTMPEFSSSSSAVPSGIVMKSTYIKHTMDEAFKNILPIPEGEDSCPVDVFIALTPEKEVDYIRLRTDCLNANVGGYLYTGNFIHDVYIAGKSFPATPDDVPADTVFAVFSYLGDQEIQLNEFYSIQQPTSGGAALVCTFGRSAGSVAVTVTQAHLSILGTTFTTSLIVNTDGISFSSDTAVSLYGVFDTVISGTIPLGSSWDDFVIQLDGTFDNNEGSFVSDVQSYIYEFTDSLVEGSDDRVEATETATADAEFAETQVTQVLSAKETEVNNMLSSKNTADSAYSSASSAYNDALSAYNSAYESASDDALESVLLLRNVCMSANVEWGKEGIPGAYCRILNTEEEILEWGLKKKTHSETRLIHSVREVTKLKWGVENYCQLVTVIKGWGRVVTDHRCSYIHTYDNITESMLDAYYDTVDISRTEAAVTETGSFAYSEKQYLANTWAESVSEAFCQYSDAACDISRKPIIENIANANDEYVQAFLNLEKAKRDLTGAEMRMKAATVAYNITRDEYAALHTCMKYTDPNLESNVQKIVQEESALQSLKTALLNSDIQDLFTISSIEFTSDINADTNSLPIDITYSVLGNPRTLTTSVELTATKELINRAIADAVLIDIGTYLQGNKRRRQATVEPTFNENQFHTRCGQLNGIILYMEMIYGSLESSYNAYMEAKANITAMIAMIDQLEANIPVEYPSIDFQFLKDAYNFEIEIDALNTQLGVAVPVANRTAGLEAVRKALMALMSGMDDYYYRCWQNDLKKIHSMGLIDTVGHIRCHGVIDCLNLVHEVIENMIIDMPDGPTKQELLAAVPTARQSLISLALYNSDLTLETALATNVTGMNNLIWRIMEEQYWCTDIPTVSEHPQTEISVQIGDTLTVECKADSVLPVTYSFEKNGFLVATGLPTGVYTKPATEYDSGLYQCLATNAVGTVQSKLSNVIVYMAPMITLSPSNYETFEGDENGGFFVCNATSYPEPMYEWEYTKDGSSWSTLSESKSNELIIPKPSEENQGWYRCKVQTEGSGMVRSSAAYLSIVKATFSKLSYQVSFLMSATMYDPEASGNDEETTPPTETVTLNYFRDQLNLTYTTVDDLQVDFSTDDKLITVRITMSVALNYSATMDFDKQAELAYMKKEDLMQGIASLQEHVKDGTFWFESEGNFFQGAHLSANLNDPMYECPTNYILAYSNFLCVTCSPGTYYTTVTGKGVCSLCPLTTYSSEDGQTECQSCPDKTDTLATGSVWLSDCLDFCVPGYYSETGLKECTKCANESFTDEYRATECKPCTPEDVERPECTATASGRTGSDGVSLTTVIIPAAIGGLVALLIIVVLVVVVIVVARKRNSKGQFDYSRSDDSRPSNPLYVPPQDVLSFVPESEKTEYRIEQKEKEIASADEDNDRDVVNPLYAEMNQGGDDGNTYDDLDEVKAQMGVN